MPVLEFKGKQHIYAHHLTVPYRPLLPDPARSCRSAGADDNEVHHLRSIMDEVFGENNFVAIDAAMFA